MTDSIISEGQCLCGEITVTARTINPAVGACHCGMCRRWGGGPLMAVDCGTDVDISPSEKLSVFDSSPWAERGFCSQCGSHLFYRLKETGQTLVPPGIFQSVDAFHFSHQVFIDQKPEFYHFANNTHDMTEAEVYASFGVSETDQS